MKSGVEANIGLELPNATVHTTHLLQFIRGKITLVRVVRRDRRVFGTSLGYSGAIEL